MAVQDPDPDWQDTQSAEAVVVAPRESHRPTPSAQVRKLGWRHPLVLALAVLVGIALVSTTVRGCVERRARIAAEETARVNAEATRKAQLLAEQQQREEAARQQARQALLEQQEAAKRQAIREREQKEEEARKAVASEADRKEKAWAKFYRKPASCNDAATMTCANDYIRARRAFELRWDRGDL